VARLPIEHIDKLDNFIELDPVFMVDMQQLLYAWYRIALKGVQRIVTGIACLNFGVEVG